ncbi:hypothetical protein RRG08_017469 [Elysia crispata]|uniref:Uncharacterized protein n=1 Tax=Elysia crispata TaxID=231223 RepID=A0AAE0YID3_9GAST|nr:hypothetical protein RRG08_017469 [Elysia crispata]
MAGKPRNNGDLARTDRLDPRGLDSSTLSGHNDPSGECQSSVTYWRYPLAVWPSQWSKGHWVTRWRLADQGGLGL